jgi:hypothetical protein
MSSLHFIALSEERLLMSPQIRQVRQGISSNTKGTAFVVYEDVADAKQACDKLNGFNFQGRYLVGMLSHHATATLIDLTRDHSALPPTREDGQINSGRARAAQGQLRSRQAEARYRIGARAILRGEVCWIADIKQEQQSQQR